MDSRDIAIAAIMLKLERLDKELDEMDPEESRDAISEKYQHLYAQLDELV